MHDPVQSSSVFTSTLTPLIGMGLIHIEKAVALTHGANIGTTVTGVLSALSGSNVDKGMRVALEHVFFNSLGTILWFCVRPVRAVPLHMAKFLGGAAANLRWFPLAYIVTVFLVLPLLVVGLAIPGWEVLCGVMTPIVIAVLLLVVWVFLRRNRAGEPAWASSAPGTSNEEALYTKAWERCSKLGCRVHAWRTHCPNLSSCKGRAAHETLCVVPSAKYVFYGHTNMDADEDEDTVYTYAEPAGTRVPEMLPFDLYKYTKEPSSSAKSEEFALSKPLSGVAYDPCTGHLHGITARGCDSSSTWAPAVQKFTLSETLKKETSANVFCTWTARSTDRRSWCGARRVWSRRTRRHTSLGRASGTRRRSACCRRSSRCGRSAAD